jgi:formate C-acetyltransferase
MVTDGTRAVGQLTFGTPLDTGDPRGFDTFEDLMAAMERQIDHQVKTEMKRYLDRYRTEAAKLAGARGPTPLASAFIQDCLARGKGYGEGGELYTIAGVDVCAIGTAADSLAAIREFVYEDQVLELGQLIDLLQNNFEGATEVRSMLRTRAPKYGNGDPAADELAARLLNYIADRMAAHAQEPDMGLPEGYRLVWGLLTGTFEWAPSHGAGLGASPDGRFASEPSSSNLAPSVGMAMHGPTAALRSYTNLPLRRLRSGAPLDLSMDGTTTAGEAGLARLMGFVRSFVDLGGNFMTITLVDGDTLRQAQREPDRYRHLRVRLGGSQAYFVGLSRAMQDYYIARVEQGFN